MRLGDVLSKPPKRNFVQIEGFLVNRKGIIGQQVKMSVGKVMLNYYCSRCEDIRTFTSRGRLSCVFVSTRIISIDCVLTCSCGTDVQVWFSVEAEEDIRGQAPKVRILKRSEKLSEKVSIVSEQYGTFSLLLNKAEHAYREGLGAGAVVYLRKIMEKITKEIAVSESISVSTPKGKPRPFNELLGEVDQKRAIIPREFSQNGYRLFGEISDVIHGDFDEEIDFAIQAISELVLWIIENVKKFVKNIIVY